jgi:YD repeat-containing protein
MKTRTQSKQLSITTLLALFVLFSFCMSARAQSSLGPSYSPLYQYSTVASAPSSSPAGACANLGDFYPNPVTPIYPVANSMCGYTCDIPQWNNFCGVAAIYTSATCPGNGNLSPDWKSCDCSSGSFYFNDVQQCVAVQQVAATPPAAKPINNGDCCAQAGDPINIGTGNSFQTQTDLAIDAPLSGLGITRTYNSLPTNPDATTMRSFGTRWTQPYDIRIAPISSVSTNPLACWQRTGIDYSWCGYSPATSTSGAVSVLRGNGKSLYFSLPTSGAGVRTWTADLGVTGQLVSTVAADGVTSTSFTFTDTDNHSETFDGNGVLLSIQAQGGSTQQLTYSTGTTNDSNVARYPVTAPVCTHVQAGDAVVAGTLLCVTDNWGRQLQFEHDIKGRITKTIAPDNQTTLYAYDGPSAGCIPANPASSVACSANNLTSVTYPDGKTKTLYYNEVAQINGGAQCSGSTPVGNGFGYLVNALTGMLDENGTRTVSWTYDCHGVATSSQLGGGVDTYQFTVGQPDTNGNSSTVVTNPLGTPMTFGFTSVNGHILNNSVAQPASNGSAAATSTSTYDTRGNMLSHTDFNGHITTYTYDTTRNLQLNRVEASGTTKARTFTNQWHATYRLPLKVAEPLLLTTYTYDSQGNVLTKTQQATTDTNGSKGLSPTASGTPRIWSYTYNNVGQILTINGPRTDVADITQFAYDTMGNLISITNAAGQVTTLGNYDLNGRIGSITDPNGLTTTYSYSPRGWLTSQQRGSEVTGYSYDNAGQLTTVTFPNSATLTYTYDNAHRLTGITDNLGNTVHYTLDAMGNRVMEQVKDSSGQLTRQISRVIDGLNRLQQLTGAQ